MRTQDLSAGPGTDSLIARKVLGTSPAPCPPFTGQIPAAWEIVENLRARGLRLHLALRRGTWEARFADRVGNGAAGRADTVPLAICRAALESVIGLSRRGAASTPARHPADGPIPAPAGSAYLVCAPASYPSPYELRASQSSPASVGWETPEEIEADLLLAAGVGR